MEERLTTVENEVSEEWGIFIEAFAINAIYWRGDVTDF